MKFVIVACVAASIAAATSWLVLRNDGEARTSKLRPAAEVETGEEPAITKRVRLPPSDRRAPASIAVASAPVPVKETEEDHPEPLSADAEDYKPFLQSEFEQQAMEPAWSRSAEESIQARLSELLGAERSFSVECRVTLCRIEISSDNMDDYMTTAKTVAHGRVYNGAGFITRKDTMDGPVHTLLAFFAREGTPLPDG